MNNKPIPNNQPLKELSGKLSQSQLYNEFNLRVENIKIPTLVSDRGNWYKKRFYLSTSDDLFLVTQSHSFKNEHVITVAGSGDFLINFLYAGAKNIECFDISPQSCYFSELKIESVKRLPYNAFIDFFYPGEYWDRYPQEEKHYSNEIYPFNMNYYKKVRDGLSEQAQKFFNLAFDPKKSGDYLKITPNSGLILRRGFSRARKFNPYLASENNYKAAQKIIGSQQYTFYPVDVMTYFKKVSEQSDYVYLSNIFSDKFDDFLKFSSNLLINGRTKRIGATLFYPHADTNIVNELKKEEVRRSIGIGEKTWEKTVFIERNQLILVDDMRINYLKSRKRTYLEITRKS